MAFHQKVAMGSGDSIFLGLLGVSLASYLVRDSTTHPILDVLLLWLIHGGHFL
jgi:hypothetical protein